MAVVEQEEGTRSEVQNDAREPTVQEGDEALATLLVSRTT
jgi:hypothetical protein